MSPTVTAPATVTHDRRDVPEAAHAAAVAVSVGEVHVVDLAEAVRAAASEVAAIQTVEATDGRPENRLTARETTAATAGRRMTPHVAVAPDDLDPDLVERRPALDHRP